ncbi:MAG: thioredoxin-like domain-containing protein [Pirellulales bacterium]
MALTVRELRLPDRNLPARPNGRPRRAAAVALACALTGSTLAGTVQAAAPTAEKALQLTPVQKDVEYDRPSESEAKRATIKAEQIGSQTGWVVRSAAGQVLRQFVDTNGDNVVDQWSYFLNGLEVYRDVDSNFNGKADQYRWLNTGGSRWGVDDNEDGEIEAWERISAEEVSAEVVRALAERDSGRFARLLLPADELKSLNLGQAKAKSLQEKLAKAIALFKTMAARQQTVSNTTQWVDFSGSQPGIVPKGTDGIGKDLLVYENVMAMVETDGKHAQVQIGTLIQVGDNWRLVDAPELIDQGHANASGGGFFFTSLASRSETGGDAPGGPDGKTQELLARLEKLDEVGAVTGDTQEHAAAVAERCDLLEEIAASVGTADERRQWLRQLADTVSAAVQAGSYPEGVERLKSLQQKLEADDAELAGYVRFRYLTAEYGLNLQSGSGDFAKIQSRWLESLREYVDDYPTSPDTAEAMLQLGIAEEFAGEEDEAKKWYTQIVASFPESPSSQKAAGAKTRLACVGKQIEIKGASPTGKMVSLAQLRKKVVLIQYWATWCEPCKTDLAQIKELQAKYGKDGFVIISISLDSRKEDLLGYLKSNPLPWLHIYEPGGLDSRLANELGILTLPTMLLVNQQGEVVNRSIHVTELDKEIRTLLR